MPQKLTTEEFKKKLFERYGNEYELIGEYNGAHDYAVFRHLCGKEKQCYPASLFNGDAKCDCLCKNA